MNKFANKNHNQMEEEPLEFIKRAILHVFVNKNKYPMDENEKESIKRFFLFVLVGLISFSIYIFFV